MLKLGDEQDISHQLTCCQLNQFSLAVFDSLLSELASHQCLFSVAMKHRCPQNILPAYKVVLQLVCLNKVSQDCLQAI